jgi:hypothetical protein
MKSIAFSALTLLALTALPARADTAIHADYSATYDRLRPKPYKGINLKNTIDVTLSGTNSVRETNTREAGTFSDSKSKSSTLGSGGWSVLGENKIQKIIDQPQSVTEMTITVDGAACKFDIQFKLKPGFTEFAFIKIMDGKIGYFTQPKVETTTCVIK